MRNVFASIVSLGASIWFGSSIDTFRPHSALEALVDRRLKEHSNQFVFHIEPQAQVNFKTHAELDTFTVFNADDGKVHIECSTTSACARGLYTYLTEVAKVDLYWVGDRLDQLLPGNLPPVGENITRQAIVPWRYHFNTVTFSYTTVWWGWEEWEYLLDWMALHGINLPLAWLGYEHILQQVLHSINLTDSDLSTFFSGPAFLSWNRFGNIQGSWGGPLPQQWIDHEFALSKRIVARMVELGMTPVFPAFTGFVPESITKVAPDANVVRGSEWNGFGTEYSNVTFLEPDDPLFAVLQERFIKLLKESYGDVSHVYTLDQYNENTPFSGELDYLRHISKDTMATLRKADPDAGWLFVDAADFWHNDRVEAYLNGVEGTSDLIILDLFSEAAPQWNRTESYYGKRWLWCLLHDYGGNMGLEGNLVDLTTQPLFALEKNPNMAGVGLTMEAQEGNEILYALLLDQAWSTGSIDSAQYVVNWLERRYGPKNVSPNILQAWDLIRLSAYNNTYKAGVNSVVKSIFELQPNVSGLTNRLGHHGTALFYDPRLLEVAWDYLHNATLENPILITIPTFRLDMIDVSRQVFANGFITIYDELIWTWTSGNSTRLEIFGDLIVDLLSTLDVILSFEETFRVGKWIKDARRWSGGHDEYADFLEYNARNQITMWGPTGQISDYASKQWAGVVGGYYLPRWKIFIEYLKDTTSGEFNYTILSEKLYEFESRWQLKKWDEEELEKNMTMRTTKPVERDLCDVLGDIKVRWVDLFRNGKLALI